MILYFSGTGNSQYIANLLAHALQDEIVSINAYTKQSLYGQFSSKEPFIFVSPVYVSAPPLVVMDFIKNSQFSGNQKAYFISTCAGGMGASPYYWKQLCQDKKFEYMGCESVIMPQNYLIYFKTKDKKTSDKIIEKATHSMDPIIESIRKQKAISMKDASKFDVASTELVLKPYYDLFIKDTAFTVNDKCIHCRKCERACPLNNIQLIDGKPTWLGNCTHCMACINLCPKEAIEYGKKSVGKPRYVAPTYQK